VLEKPLKDYRNCPVVCEVARLLRANLSQWAKKTFPTGHHPLALMTVLVERLSYRTH
jgi:hypothetical protein